MKEHISATLDRDLVERARKHARETRRSLSNVIEIALTEALDLEPLRQGVVTTPARFAGKFDRRDTYAGR